jgi:hypothetical protein
MVKPGVKHCANGVAVDTVRGIPRMQTANTIRLANTANAALGEGCQPVVGQQKCALVRAQKGIPMVFMALMVRSHGSLNSRTTINPLLQHGDGSRRLKTIQGQI